MKVKKLLHTRMRVSDMDQTINFYTNVLGLEVLERKVSPRGSHLAFLKVPNSEELIELCSFPPSGPVKVQEDLVHLAFQVENLDDTIATTRRQTDSNHGRPNLKLFRQPLHFHRCPGRLRSRTHRTPAWREDRLNPASRPSFPPHTVHARYLSPVFLSTQGAVHEERILPRTWAGQ